MSIVLQEESALMFTVGLDFDGVAIRIDELTRMTLKDHFGIILENGTERLDILLREKHISHDQFWSLVESMCCTEEYFQQMWPVDGMLLELPRLQRELPFARFQFITSRRRPHGSGIAEKWLRGCGLRIPIFGVNAVNAHGSKADHVSGFHVFVDDDLHHLVAMEGIVPNRFLFGWEYNRHDTAPGVIRVENWNNLATHIRMLATAYSLE